MSESLPIGPDTVAKIRFRMTDESGTVLDASCESNALEYLHGHENIVPGLEEALAGQIAGASVEVVVPPAKAFGARRRVKALRLRRSEFSQDMRLEVGASFVMQGPQGNTPMYVTKVIGREVHATPQHPWAGLTLHVSCTVDSVRPATAEETQAGWPAPREGTSCSCC